VTAVQQNLLALLGVGLGVAVLVSIVIIASSDTVRRQGFRTIMKRWLGR
jgi:hypothetical protein